MAKKLTSLSDTAAVNAFAKAAIEHLRPLAAEYGLTLRMAGGRIEYKDFVFKVQCTLDQSTEAGEQASRQEWHMHCRSFGLLPDWFGKTYTEVSGSTMKVVGIYPKKRKNCVRIQNVATGKTFITSAKTVQFYLQDKNKK